jgi:hypothetical protein
VIAAQSAAIAQMGAHIAPESATSTKFASREEARAHWQEGRQERPGETKAQGKKAKPAEKRRPRPASPREFSNKAIVVDLLRRKDGATMAKIAQATDWQNHSIRGFISGTLTKKMKLNVESSKSPDGGGAYPSKASEVPPSVTAAFGGTGQAVRPDQ